MPPRPHRALLLLSLSSLATACAPSPPEPAVPTVITATIPPPSASAAADPTIAPPPPTPIPTPAPPAAPAAAPARPALPPEDPALGRLRLRLHSPADPEARECMLPLIREVAPLADGGAWITGGCNMRLLFDGKTFTNHAPARDKRTYRSDGKNQTCLANTVSDAVWARSGRESVITSRYICGSTSFTLGFRAIERFDGKRWTKLSTALPPGMNDDLFPDSIQGSKPEALWGLVPSSMLWWSQGPAEAPVRAGLYRLGPKGWDKPLRKSDVPARLQDLPAGSQIESYRAMTARGDEVWIAGGRIAWNGARMESLGAVTWHWDGSQWTEQHPAADVFHAISMADDGALWAASADALWRWDRGAWTKVDTGLDPSTTITSLWAGGAADVWILLKPPAAPKAAQPTVLAHHDGTRLGRVAVEPAAQGASAHLDSLRGAGGHVWAWDTEDAWEIVRPTEAAGAAPPVFTYSSVSAARK